MAERKKSKKEQKIEASLGISSDDDFDMSEDIVDDNDEDIEEKEKLDKRKEIASNTKNALAVYAENKNEKGYDSDEEFTRDMLRDLAITGMTVLKLQENEMEIDPSARNAETAAALITAVTNSVDKLHSVGLNKKKLEIEEKKANRHDGPNTVNNNFIGVSSFSEMIKNLKDSGEDIGTVSNSVKTKEVEAEIVEEGEENAD